jgi:cell division protein FtsN
VRPNTFLLGLTLIGLFAVSLVVGYVVGERYLKPRPIGTPGPGVATPAPSPRQPAPPTAPAVRPTVTPEAAPVPTVSPTREPTPLPTEAPTPRPTRTIARPDVTATPRATGTVRPSPGVTAASPAGRMYRVQIGAFGSRANADERAAALRAAGFSPYVVREGTLFKVRAGVFRERSEAEALAERLRARGFAVTIVQ